MAIDIEKFDEGWDEWDRLVNRSPDGTIFHTSSVLNAIVQSIDVKLHKYIGYKGQEPVGIFPLFETKKGPFSLVYSPPPETGIPFCGPALLNYKKLDRRKRDRLTKSFIDNWLESIFEDVKPSYYDLVTPTNYEDPRPLQWKNFDVSPQYTYTLDITPSKENLLKTFTRDLRTNITDDYQQAITIETGGHDAIEFILNRIKERYEAQGRSIYLSTEFVHKLYDESSDENMMVYIGRVNDEMESGMIILQDNTTQYYWHGGGKPNTEIPINDLIHWQVISDGKDAGIENYDLVGANTPRLTDYKAKFDPKITEYYRATRETFWSQVYKKVIL